MPIYPATLIRAKIDVKRGSHIECIDLRKACPADGLMRHRCSSILPKKLTGDRQSCARYSKVMLRMTFNAQKNDRQSAIITGQRIVWVSGKTLTLASDNCDCWLLADNRTATSKTSFYENWHWSCDSIRNWKKASSLSYALWIAKDPGSLKVYTSNEVYIESYNPLEGFLLFVCIAGTRSRSL